MLRLLVKNPGDLPTILRTALDARAARATLMRGRQLLGPRLGLPDFRARARRGLNASCDPAAHA